MPALAAICFIGASRPCNDLHTGLLIAGCLCSQSLNRCDKRLHKLHRRLLRCLPQQLRGLRSVHPRCGASALHLGLGCSANLDNCYAAGQLGQTLLQLLNGRSQRWCARIAPRISATRFAIACLSPAPSTMVVFSLGYLDPGRAEPQHIHGSVSSSIPTSLRDYGTAGQDCDVAGISLRRSPKRSLNSYAGERCRADWFTIRVEWEPRPQRPQR